MLTRSNSWTKLTCALLILLTLINETHEPDPAITRHIWAGGSISTHCNNGQLKAPPDITVHELSIVKDAEEMYVYTAYSQRQSPSADRWYVSPTGLEVRGENLRLKPSFNMDISLDDAQTSDHGFLKCRIIYTKKGRHNIESKERNILFLYVHNWDEPCQAHWLYYAQGNTCVKLFHKPMPWKDARGTCTQEHHGELVIILSSEFDDFLYSLIGKQTYWIGLTREKGKAYFVWINKSKVEYSHWRPGSPTDNRQNECAEKGKYGGGVWSNDNCGTRKKFICQRSKDAESESTPVYYILKVLVIVLLVLVMLGVTMGCISVVRRPLCRKKLVKIKKTIHRKVKRRRRKKHNVVVKDKDNGTYEIQDPMRLVPATRGRVYVLYDSALNDLFDTDGDTGTSVDT